MMEGQEEILAKAIQEPATQDQEVRVVLEIAAIKEASPVEARAVMTAAKEAAVVEVAVAGAAVK